MRILAVLAACQTRQWPKNAVCEYCHKRRIILGAENNEQSYKNYTLMVTIDFQFGAS